MYDDITEALEKDVLPHLKTNYESLVDKIKTKYNVEKAANISKDLKLLQVMKKIPIISVSLFYKVFFFC